MNDVDPAARRSERDIPKKLAKKVTVDLAGQTLETALKQLAKIGGFDLVFDPEAVATGDLLLDTPLPKTRFTDTSIRRVIEYILSVHIDVQLSFVMQDGVLKIVTREECDDIRASRVFSIRELLKPDAPTPVVPMPHDAGMGPHGQHVFRNDADILISALKSSNGGFWEEDDPDLGGSISRIGRDLAVRQMRTSMEEIEELLNGLRIAARAELKGGAYQVRHAHYDHAAEAAVRKALRKTIAVNFQKATLKTVMKEIGKKAGFTIVADREGIAIGDVSLDSTINLNLKSCTVRSALNLILKQHADVELSFLINEGILTIVTRGKADSVQKITIYDVRDFLAREIDNDTLIRAIYDQTSGIWDEDDPDLCGTIEAIDSLGVIVVRQTDEVHGEIARLLTDLRKRRKTADKKAAANGKLPADPLTDDSLVTKFYPFLFKERAEAVRKSLTQFVAPKTWQAKGTDAAIDHVEGTLIIRQTVKVHRAIGEFLSKLDKSERLATQNLGGF